MEDAAATLESLLPGLALPHVEALLEALAWIEASLDPEGIVATGSIVRGEGHRGSDLDLVVFWRRPGRQRLQRRFAGVPVEIFANSAAWLRHSIQVESARGRPVLAHMLATGVVLRDNAGAMAVVVAEAAQALRAGPALPDEEKLRLRYLAACAVEDALDLLPSTDGDAVLVARRAVDAMLDFAFLSHGRFLPRPKRRLAELRALDAEAATALAAALAAGAESQADRLSAAALLILGADAFFPWDSALQCSDPPAPSVGRAGDEGGGGITTTKER